MITDPVMNRIADELFADPDARIYAVLDGASIEGLLDSFNTHQPDHLCLYRGELAPDLAEAAPYLVQLKSRDPFTEWVLREGWGNHWGILAVTLADMRMMRRHFRRFLMVKDPDGKQIYFRYYDPRVLRVFLPTCNAAETETLFGPISSYVLEGEDSSVLLRFSSDGEKIRTEKVPLGQAQ